MKKRYNNCSTRQLWLIIMLLIPVLNGNAQQSVSRTIQDNNAYIGTSYAENTIYSIDTTSLNSKLPIPIQLGKNKRFRNTNAYILDDSSLNMNPPITHGVFKHNGIWKKNTALFSLPTLETESIFKATTGSSMAASIMSQNCACPSINPPNSTGDKAFCAGSSIPPISVSVATNETVDWYDAPTAGNLIASNNISYQANQSGTYYAETRNTIYGYKSKIRTAVSLTQNDLPNLSLLGTICAADLKTYSITVSSNGSVSSSICSISGNIVSGIPAGTNVILTATSSAGCQTTLAVISPNCTCTNINPPNSTGNKSFCAGSSIPLISVSVATNETVDWYDAPAAGNLIASNNTSYQANQSGTYYAETKNTVYGCKSNTRTAISITQNDLPNLLLSSAVCVANLKTYFIYVSSNGLLNSSAGTVSGNTVSGIPAGTNVILTATSSVGCQTKLAVISPNCACPSVSPPNSTGNKAFCAGSLIPPISVSVATNETVDWYDAPTAGNLIASNNTSYQANQSGTYYAETKNTIHGCKSNTRTAVSLIKNTLPSISLLGTTCAADLKTYSITVSSNGLLNSSVGTVSSNTVSSIPTSTNVILTATSLAGCQSTLAVISPNCACPSVNPPNSTGNKAFCAGSSIPLISVSVATNETVDWYDAPTAGNLIASNNTSYQANQSGTYYAETRNTIHGCKSNTRTAVSLIQNTLPSISLLGTTCAADLKTYSITVFSNSSVSSSICSMSGNTVSGIPTGTNVILTATSLAGCQSILAVISPNCACPSVNPPNSTGDKAFCAGSLIPPISVSVATNETVDWYDAPTAGNLIASNNISYQANQSGTYYAETRNTIYGYKSNTRTAVSLIQNTLPSISLLGTTCAADLKTYSITVSSNGLLNSSAGTISGNTVSSIPAGTNVSLTATSSAGCQSSLAVTAPICSPCVLTVKASATTITQGQNTTLQAVGCTGYFTWQGTNKEGTDITVPPLVTTTYTGACWLGEGEPQCTAEITINVNPCQLSATASKETINKGESTVLTALGCENGTLIWVDSKSELATITVNPLMTTTYTAKCWYSEGVESCSISKTITVNPCQLSATATEDTINQGESTVLTASGCENGTLAWVDSKSELATITVKPLVTTTYTAKCWYTSGAESCNVSKTIMVNPCQLSATANVDVLVLGESLQIKSTGCVGTLIYPQDTTQNGNSVFTYTPTKSQGFTVQCKVENTISCDTTINIVVAPCHLQARAEKATLTGGELLKITSSGCIGTLIYPSDTTQNGKSVFTYLPTRSQSFSIQCKVGKIISCDTTMNIVVDKCPSIIQATAATIVKGDYTTLSYQGCPNTVVWRGLGQGMSKNVSPSKTTTYYASCNYGDKLQYSCSTDSIVIKVRPKQPILDNTRLGVSGIALQDTICLNNSLILGVNCDVDAKAYWNDKQLNELKVDASQASIQTYRFYCQNADGKSDESLAEIVVKGFEVEDAIIYPVPTAGLLHIKSKGCLDNLRLTLYSLSGQVLYQGNGESRTSDSISIDLTFLPSNEYVLHISGRQGNQPMTKRVRIVKYSK